jgi:hypothetical protein
MALSCSAGYWKGVDEFKVDESRESSFGLTHALRAEGPLIRLLGDACNSCESLYCHHALCSGLGGATQRSISNLDGIMRWSGIWAAREAIEDDEGGRIRSLMALLGDVC